MSKFMKSALLIVSCILVSSAGASSYALQARDILKSDFKEEKYWPRASKGAVEFCGGDWCQEVMGVDPKSSGAAWDAAFILFYYLDPNDDYSKHRRDVADRILARSGRDCPSMGKDKRVTCALEALRKKFGFRYRRVQYDVGYRCHSEIDTKPPFFTKKGGCERMKKGAFPAQFD